MMPMVPQFPTGVAADQRLRAKVASGTAASILAVAESPAIPASPGTLRTGR